MLKKFVSILVIFVFYFSVNPSLFAQKSDTALTRIRNIDSPKAKANAYCLLSNSSWKEGNYDKTITYTDEGLAFCKAKQFQFEEVKLYNDRGIANEYLGNYSAALDVYFKGLRIAEKRNFKELEGNILSNIGLIFFYQKLPKKACYYFNKSLKIRTTIKDEEGVFICLNNLSNVYMSQKKFSLAKKNYLACSAHDIQVKDSNSLSADFNNLGICLMYMKDYDSSKYYLDLSLLIRTKLDNSFGISQTKTSLAALYEKTGNYKQAIRTLKEAIPHSEKIGRKESLKIIYYDLCAFSEKIHDSVAAYRYFQKYIFYRDQIENAETARKQTETELNFNFEKEKEITKREQEKKDAQARFILWGTLSILFLIAVFSTIFYRKWKQAKKQQLIIAEKNTLVEEKNKEILDSITYALRIQKAILPSDELITSDFPESSVFYLPKDIVAGDFYFYLKQGDFVVFATADCTGHGVPGAFMSVICHNALKRAVQEFDKRLASEILDKTRELIVDDLSTNENTVSDGMDISLCSFSLKEQTYYWAGAHNPLWIFSKNKNELIEIKADKQPIGKYPTYIPFTNHQLDLQKGDRLYLFSDGFSDQFGGENGKKFMSRNFKNTLINSQKLTVKEQIEELKRTFFAWKKNMEQLDDVTVWAIEI